MVRYTRLSETQLEAEKRNDLDLAMRADPPEDWAVLAPSVDSLELVLRRFLPDLDTIRLPADVDYPEPPLVFARKRSLDEVLGAP
jgi:hypothetical protein